MLLSRPTAFGRGWCLWSRRGKFYFFMTLTSKTIQNRLCMCLIIIIECVFSIRESKYIDIKYLTIRGRVKDKKVIIDPFLCSS